MTFKQTLARKLPTPVLEKLMPAYQRILPGWTYRADGMATAHYSPFIEDPAFTAAYDRMAGEWTPGKIIDARWRMWLLTRLALQARALPGDYAEFGTYRGGCAYMVLSLVDLTGRRLHLFDTFAGIPAENLTDHEQDAGYAGRLDDTSAGYVRDLLSRWSPVPAIHAGDVMQTVPGDLGSLAWAHIDLNAAVPTAHVLERVYPLLVPGAVVLFDDYGWGGYEDQRAVIDEFMTEVPEVLVALPTGQATFTKASKPAVTTPR